MLRKYLKIPWRFDTGRTLVRRRRALVQVTAVEALPNHLFLPLESAAGCEIVSQGAKHQLVMCLSNVYCSKCFCRSWKTLFFGNPRKNLVHFVVDKKFKFC